MLPKRFNISISISSKEQKSKFAILTNNLSSLQELQSLIMQSFPRLVTKRSGSRFIRPTPRCSCARMPTTSGRQESINRKNSAALQGAAERESFDQSGVWGASPQQAKGDFR